MDNAGIYWFASFAKPPALRLRRRCQQPWLKLDLAHLISLLFVKARRLSKNVLSCYPSSLKIPKCVLKQQPHNLQLSDAVAFGRFWFFPSTRGGLFLVLFDSFRKGHVPHFTKKHKRSSFPNQWTKLHDDNTTNFARKYGIQSIKYKIWVELSRNFCHLSDIIRPPA